MLDFRTIFHMWQREDRQTLDSLKPKPAIPAAELKHFRTALPLDCRWFVFVDPEDSTRWVIGWLDWHHVRIESGPSYATDDPRLTWWYPLPDVPYGSSIPKENNDLRSPDASGG